MKSRRLLHSLTLMFRIKNQKAPMYLCNRLKSHNATHNYCTRNRFNIDPPFTRSKLRSMSLFIYISTQFNELTKYVDIRNVSVSTFKLRCKSYLLNKQ